MIDGTEGIEDTLQLVDHELEHLAQARAEELMGTSPASLQRVREASRYADLLVRRTVLTDRLGPGRFEGAMDAF